MHRSWPLMLSAALALTLARPPAAAASPWYRGDAGSRRLLHLAGIAAGGALYAISETVAKPSLAPDQCRWCNSNGLDDRVRNAVRWSDTAGAGTLSNLSGYVASPALMLGLTALSAARGDDDERGGRIVDDVIPVLETVVYSELAVQVVKFSFGRRRPFANAAGLDEPGANHDNNLSFFSGHTTLTVGLVVSAGLAAHRRDSPLEPLIWATGIPLAAVTGYLRIAADKHYATDVLAGAAWGTAAALLIPRLTHALPDQISLVPQPGGLALAGAF